MKLKKEEKYKIDWKDTFNLGGWWDSDEIEERTKKMDTYIETIGYYIGEWYGFLVFSQNINKDEGMKKWANPIWIPVACIKKVTKIK